MLKFTKRDYKFINKNVCIRKFKLFKKLKCVCRSNLIPINSFLLQNIKKNLRY